MKDFEKTIDELLDRVFFEDFIKECIINELMLGLEIAEGKETTFLRGCSDLTLTYARVSQEVYKFALTGIVIFDLNNKDSKVYEVDGIITTLNFGKIRISSYDSREY